MTGEQLKDFCTEVNGGATIGRTLLFQFLNLSKAMVEQLRPWMILRYIDTSKTVSASSSSAWATAIDLSAIARFNRFLESTEASPIQLFDGSNRIEDYWPEPFNRRLYVKDFANRFVYDEANKNLYLNGSIPFSGTLYIHHLKDSADLDIGSANTAWPFPTWSHPLLGFMAVAMHKGGVDYDDINARMSPENRGQAELIIKRLESWDNEKQLSEISSHDPTLPHDEGFRSGAINIH